jgi:CTP:molybdopterin cytidylyltransferase MocA
VALRSARLARYLEPDPPPLRELLRGLGHAAADVEVDEPVSADLNTPADLAAYGQPLPARFVR